MLGNAAADLGPSKESMSDYCLMIECYPDNNAPALFGDFIAAFIDTALIKILPNGVLPNLSEDTHTSLRLL